MVLSKFTTYGIVHRSLLNDVSSNIINPVAWMYTCEKLAVFTDDEIAHYRVAL